VIQIVTSQDHFYISSAVELAAIALEEEPKAQSRLFYQRRHPACVIGAVTCSVSFLECTINGLYEDASKHTKGLKFHRSLQSIWSETFERLPILAKYQLALTLARREILPIGADPYQSAQALIELRNTVAHPKEIIGRQKNQQKLEKQLTGKYEFGALRPHRHEFFPERCLTAACAIWAAKTALEFTVEFKRCLPNTAYLHDTSNNQLFLLKYLDQLVKRSTGAVTK
jgi:hypothetical protein